MRKSAVVICLILAFFVTFFLQVNIFSLFTIAGVSPNLFVMFVLFIGLFANQFLGISLGVLFGLILDFVYGRVIGTTAIMLCVIGYLGSYFDKNFSKENKLTIMFMVAGATLIYEFGLYFLNSIILDFSREYFAFIKIALIECLYNILLAIIFYPMVQKFGYLIDRTFKKNNILTRYF